MPRLCARPGCSAPATATFTFDGLRRIVWLAPLADASAYSAGDLCRRHAERFTAPRNWELRDVRPVPDVAEPAGAPAPSRYAAPPPPPPHPLPFERPAARVTPGAPAATGPSVAPVARAADDDAPAGDAPGVTGPLLSRAFRNAG